MLKRALPLLLLAAALAAPTSADAAEKWRCTAAPIAGTVLGQPVVVTPAGSLTAECGNASTLPTLEVPGLLKLDAVNGVTAANADGAYAGAGLASLNVGALPIPLPAIPVPDELKTIQVSLPAIPPLVPAIPVATVDLTPAIEAIQNLPTKSLVDAGTLYSAVSARCDNGRPVLSGAGRVLDASILGLPVDAGKAVDTTVNLLDTASIPLNTLDLAKVKVNLLGVVGVDTAAVLNLLKPILDSLPPLAIPEQLARVKLTPPSQETIDGVLVQRALRAQVSLAGLSIADLAIGVAAVGPGDNPCPAPAPAETPEADSAPEAALECTTRKLALIDVLRRGNRVRLFGAADKSLAGKRVKIRFQATKRVVATTTVRPDGSFTATAPLPARNVRNTNRARYIATSGGERSLNLKLTRRMIVTSVRSAGNRVTIKGRVTSPRAPRPQTITLKRRVTCKTLQTVKRFKPRRDGRFSVTVTKPANLAATVYRLQTKVRTSPTNPKLYPTFTLPRAVDL